MTLTRNKHPFKTKYDQITTNIYPDHMYQYHQVVYTVVTA